MSAGRKLLVISAHPDDEILGGGWTVAKYAEQGDEVHHLIIGDGITSRYPESELQQPQVVAQVKRIAEDARRAGEIVGASRVTVRGHLCCRFDKVPLLDITKLIEEEITHFRPEVVYTQGPYDVNYDHELVFKAVLAATRPMPNSPVKTVLAYGVLSSTEWNFYTPFRPTVYEDIRGSIDRKVAAMQAYGSEYRQFPHPRSEESIRTLAKKRGSEVGLPYAEAFELIRDIR